MAENENNVFFQYDIDQPSWILKNWILVTGLYHCTNLFRCIKCQSFFKVWWYFTKIWRYDNFQVGVFKLCWIFEVLHIRPLLHLLHAFCVFLENLTKIRQSDLQLWQNRHFLKCCLCAYRIYKSWILIKPIFLYGSECWAVTKWDVLKIDALDQWCLRKLLGIKRGLMTLNRATLKRATFKRRQFIGRQLIGATVNRSDK